jgi:hypothetical protein
MPGKAPPRRPTLDLPPNATLLQAIHELRRQGITAGPHSKPDLRALPQRLRHQITAAARDRKLNMENAERAIADEVVVTVLATVAGLSPARQAHLPEELGVDRVPGLAYVTSTAGRRRRLAAAFQRALSTQKALDGFRDASFMLQADAYDNADRDHPLCSMWNAGGLHAVLYMGAPYDDGPVAGWFGMGKAREGRGTRGRRGRGRRATRRRGARRATRRRGQR